MKIELISVFFDVIKVAKFQWKDVAVTRTDGVC